MSGRRTARTLSQRTLIRLVATVALAVALVVFPAAAMAAHGGGGGGGGGGDASTGETTTIANNLSFPTIWSDGITLPAPFTTYQAGTAPAGTLDAPKWTDSTAVTVGDKTLYPQGAADPADPTGATAANIWQAENALATAAVNVSQIDWGDNLEGTSVSRMLGKPIRVETTLLESLTTPMTGYDMFSISGSKDTEVFGTDKTTYASPVADVYSGCARLTIQRLDISRSDPYVSSMKWDPVSGEWTGKGLIAPPMFNGGVWAGSEGSGYSAEINGSGKVVYGYNWQTSGLSAGDYRITFSLDPNCPAGTVNTFITDATTILASTEGTVTPAAESGGTGETGGGSVAQIDATDNLSYIDVELGNPSYAPYVPPAPEGTAAPVISGIARQGETLSTSTGDWDNVPSSYSYQWQTCDSAGYGCSDIAGATAATYQLTAADVGRTVRVVVTATNDNGSVSATSATTAVVAPLAPTNKALPVILGSAQVGHVLMATNGAWENTPTSYAYQWQIWDAGAGWTDLAGANAGSYTLTDAVVGHTLRVIVIATNAGGSTAAISATTAVVAAQQQQQIQQQQQQQQRTQQKTKARVTLSLAWLRGERLHLWGSVYPPHNGKRVMIQEQTRTGWKTVAKVWLHKATQQRSQFATTLAHPTPGVYRAYMGADAIHLASDSSVIRARARSTVTLQLQQLTRDRLRLSGSVFPTHNGQKLMVQVRTRTGWKTVATVRLRKATRQRSQYTITRAHLKAGVYRAYYGGDSGYRPGNSTPVTVH